MKGKVIILLLLGSSLLLAQKVPSTGRVKMDIEVTDDRGIYAQTKMVTLKNLTASEIEPFVRARLSIYGTVQVNDALNMLIITDMEPKLTDLVKLVRELDKMGAKEFLRLETEAIAPKYITPSKAEEIVKTNLSVDGNVRVDDDLGLIVITDVGSRIDRIKEILSLFDVPIKQVAIEGKILEVDSDYLKTLGLDPLTLLSTVARGRATFQESSDEHYGKRTSYSASIDLDLEKFISSIDQFIKEGRGNLYSMPRIVVQNNKRGMIRLEDIIRTYGGGHYPVVTRLSVTPHIGADDAITLDLHLEHSTITSPEHNLTTTRTLQSTLLIKDGETIILGGITSKLTARREKGIPLLKDIPLLGYFFKRTEDVVYDRDVVIFVTPHILEYGETPEEWEKFEEREEK
ncbi:hypothetical protein CH333_00090 [candidate division WOR-3 bacterium JGI_Cruoil_03_44_89]|uniref:Type II/III secretion system secretin-like domain-containing protein n=1 Tax=candidate division WOR-3 bacterium JGI_Cruoil_03_44_89 TaxID=1973748 RepID=A0A235BZJ5_UNCW3|nr:MAG: hypothetical protein CH333_00090 [candidate division WOR-3 bacterium JGI_Cruoil_03_44_89]